MGLNLVNALRDLVRALPAARIGIYMGVFNFFIVIPEIVQALTFALSFARYSAMKTATRLFTW